MSRPLILRVDNHVPHQSNRKVTGAIDIQLLKQTNNADDSCPNIDKSINVNRLRLIDQNEFSSLLRNLTSTINSNLMKFKSKSMLDVRPNTAVFSDNLIPDAAVFKYPSYEDSRSQSHYFQKAPSKSKNDDKITEVRSLKEKARSLLNSSAESRNNFDDLRAWQKETIPILRYICKLPGNPNEAETAPNVNGDASDNQRLNVNELKNVFETIISDGATLKRSVSLSARYFTGKQPKSGNESGDARDLQEARPMSTSNIKIRELKSYFESISDEPESKSFNGFDDDPGTKQRMLPPAKVLILNDNSKDENDVEDSKRKIDKFVKKIEANREIIEKLTKDDKDAASNVNEALIGILIKLDDVKTYENAQLLTERRKAIEFVQICIRRLRKKMREHE